MKLPLVSSLAGTMVFNKEIDNFITVTPTRFQVFVTLVMILNSAKITVHKM